MKVKLKVEVVTRYEVDLEVEADEGDDPTDLTDEERELAITRAGAGMGTVQSVEIGEVTEVTS